jgi:pathogenesis-related protein 1
VRATIVYALLTAAATAAGEDSLARDMLVAHNGVRATVKVAPLVWSDNLARSAQEWANTLLEKRQFVHRPKSKFGENLYEVQGAKATPKQVVDRWASEAANFDYKTNKCRGACGHYTQIVWSGTKEVGCAVARGGAREVWVCEYNPPGNYIGHRPY